MDVGALVELLVSMAEEPVPPGEKSSEVEQVNQENTSKKCDPLPLLPEKRRWTWLDPMWAMDPNVKAYMAMPEVKPYL